MRKARLLGIVVAFAAFSVISFSAQNRSRNAGDSNNFIGAWRLVWLEEPDAEGKIHKADCTGLLVYTSDGHMSVQVMYQNAGDNAVAPVQYAKGGYEASYGTYHVDDKQTFTFHVQGALVRTLIGKDLKRSYELTGNRLIVKSPDPNEHWRVAWQRY